MFEINVSLTLHPDSCYILRSIVKWISWCPRSADLWLDCYSSSFLFSFFPSDSFVILKHQLTFRTVGPLLSHPPTCESNRACVGCCFQYSGLKINSTSSLLVVSETVFRVQKGILQSECAAAQERRPAEVWANCDFPQISLRYQTCSLLWQSFVQSGRFDDGSCRHCFQCEIFPHAGFVILR